MGLQQASWLAAWEGRLGAELLTSQAKTKAFTFCDVNSPSFEGLGANLKMFCETLLMPDKNPIPRQIQPASNQLQVCTQ